MDYHLNVELMGYHGTDIKRVDSIITNGYHFSSGEEWLGKGVYFFESLSTIVNGFSEAKNWVLFVKKSQNWAVFKAKISSSRYIDLASNISHREIYDKIRKEAIKKHLEAGKERKDFLERTIYIKFEETVTIDFIRVMVDAQKNMGYYAYTVRRPQIQICVKNVKCIVENTLYKSFRRI